MKKQTKSKKAQPTKMAKAMTRAVAGHSRRQRILAFIALTGLFLCGLFVGMDVKSRSCNVPQNNEPIEDLANVTGPQDICGEVERLLARHLPAATDVVEDRIERAKIYASMAERGCEENSETYVELAAQELDIARAIDDDTFNRQETIDIVETYKRLSMQAAAQEIFEKAKKLTDPAIDFIIQVEKIINE